MPLNPDGTMNPIPNPPEDPQLQPLPSEQLVQPPEDLTLTAQVTLQTPPTPSSEGQPSDPGVGGVDFFDTVLADKILGEEGHYSNNPDDSGGETNWGITKATARDNGFLGNMRDMTRVDALRIYKAKFYLRAGVHLLVPLSKRIASAVFDTGVNCGVGTAGMYLQRALNVSNKKGVTYSDIKVDGMVGSGTAAHLGAYLGARPKDGEIIMLRELGSLRGCHYIVLAEKDEHDETFINGWFANRVEET